MQRLDATKLQSQETTETYVTRLKELLHAPEPAPELDQQWQNIAQSKSQKLTWYDEECRQAAIDKDIAYRTTFHKLPPVQLMKGTALKGERKSASLEKRGMSS